MGAMWTTSVVLGSSRHVHSDKVARLAIQVRENKWKFRKSVLNEGGLANIPLSVCFDI